MIIGGDYLAYAEYLCFFAAEGRGKALCLYRYSCGIATVQVCGPE